MNWHGAIKNCFIFLFLSITPVSWAEENPPVPDILPDVITANSEQVLTMVESGKMLIIDARKEGDFQGGSVPGAINCTITSGLPNIDAADVEKSITDIRNCPDVIGADHTKAVVTICNGLHCWRSAKAALALRKLGFTKVHWYRLGMNDWKEKGLPME